MATPSHAVCRPLNNTCCLPSFSSTITDLDFKVLRIKQRIFSEQGPTSCGCHLKVTDSQLWTRNQLCVNLVPDLSVSDHILQCWAAACHPWWLRPGAASEDPRPDDERGHSSWLWSRYSFECLQVVIQKYLFVNSSGTRKHRNTVSLLVPPPAKNISCQKNSAKHLDYS